MKLFIFVNYAKQLTEGTLTSPNTRPIPADKQTEDTAVPVADWVDLTEKELPDSRQQERHSNKQKGSDPVSEKECADRKPANRIAKQPAQQQNSQQSP
jgi:hypothetical protein